MITTNSWIAIAIVFFAVMVAVINTNAGQFLTDWLDDSTIVAQRQGGNFISGDGVNVAGADNSSSGRVDFTLSAVIPTTGTLANTESFSGLQVTSSGISLLLGCSDNQIPKWDATQGDWNCESDETGAGGSSEWTDTGTVLHPNESGSDEVVIGGTTEAGADIFLGVDGAAVFNEQSGSTGDFRVETDGKVNMFFIDYSANAIGIDTNAPDAEFDLHHQATETFDTAMRIDHEVNSLGGTIALRVDVHADGLVAEEESAAIDISLDTSTSTGGELDAIRINAIGEGTAALHGISIGPEITVIEHNSGTFANLGFCEIFDDSASTFTDCLTAFNSTGTDVQMFVEDNDIVYVGNSDQFGAISFVLAIVASGPGIAPVFEHSAAGDTFTTFVPDDDTNGMRDSGSINYDADVLTDWVAATVDGDSAFWIRITRTRNTLTTPPTEDIVQLAVIVEFLWDQNGALNALTYSFEGSTADASEHLLTVTDPTADRTFTFPDDQLADDDAVIGIGSGLLGYTALPDCDDTSGNHLNYDQGTNAYSCGTTSGAATDFSVADDVVANFGTDSDNAFVHRSTTLAANTALTDVLIGTPVTLATPANSLIISNITADGDLVFATNTGGNSIEGMRIDASARSLVLPSVNDSGTPTLAYGDGDSGWYEISDDALGLALGGAVTVVFAGAGEVRSESTSDGWRLGPGNAAVTTPVYLFEGDLDTGIGKAGADQLSLISGGVEYLRIVEATSAVTGNLSGGIAFQQASQIVSTAGDITFLPASNTDTSASPLTIQNVSQNDTPGTTTNGQIRLWRDADVGGVDGRIIAQINGTTYQWNADAGLTFENRSLTFNADLARFAAAHSKWQDDRRSAISSEYNAFRLANPDLLLVALPSSWTEVYINAVNSEYSKARAILKAREEAARFAGEEFIAIAVPSIPTWRELNNENPWPDPATYRIPDPDSNETVSFRTGTQITPGDPLVLVADRTRVDPVSGENIAIHAVPSTLKDEMLWLLENDPAFLRDIKDLLGIG